VLRAAHLHARVGDHPIGFLQFAASAFDFDGDDMLAVRELSRKLAGAECTARILAITILFHLQPQHVQIIRAVVGVGDDFLAGQLALAGSSVALIW
jgi:hypothetical protein